MRILTLPEQRQIETLKRELTDMPTDGIELFIPYADRELWLNLVAVIQSANDAMGIAWRCSPNPRTNLVDLVKMALSD